MTTEADLKEIKSMLSELNKKIDVLLKEKEPLVGCEPPLEDEVEAIREYEAAKKKGKVELIPLRKAAKGT